MATTPRSGGSSGGGTAQRPNGTSQSKSCQFKLVLLGESAVGKSSLVLRFVKGQFHEYQESTIGAAFLTQTVCIDDTVVKFEIWDTAGQERYTNIIYPYIHTHMFDFVYIYNFKILQIPQLSSHVLQRCTSRHCCI